MLTYHCDLLSESQMATKLDYLSDLTCFSIMHHKYLTRCLLATNQFVEVNYIMHIYAFVSDWNRLTLKRCRLSYYFKLRSKTKCVK